MTDEIKDIQESISPKIITRVNTTGLTIAEISKVMDLAKLRNYLDPIISKIDDPGGVVMDRDISGHVHTTG